MNIFKTHFSNMLDVLFKRREKSDIFFQKALVFPNWCDVLVTFPSHLKILHSIIKCEKLNCVFFTHLICEKTPKTTFSVQCRNCYFLH